MFQLSLILLAFCLISTAYAKPRKCAETVDSEIARVGPAPARELIPLRANGSFFSPHLLDPERERIRANLTPQHGSLRFFAMSDCGKFALSVVDYPEAGQLVALYSVTKGELKRMYEMKPESPVVVGAISSVSSSIVVVTESGFVKASEFEDFFQSPDDVGQISLRAKAEWFAAKGESPQIDYVGFARDPEEEQANEVITVISELSMFHFFYHAENRTLARHRTPARLTLPRGATSSRVQGITVHDNSLRLGVWTGNTIVTVLRYLPDMRRYQHDPQSGAILQKSTTSSE